MKMMFQVKAVLVLLHGSRFHYINSTINLLSALSLQPRIPAKGWELNSFVH